MSKMRTLTLSSLLLTTFCVLAISPQAKATSVYDNVVRITSGIQTSVNDYYGINYEPHHYDLGSVFSLLANQQNWVYPSEYTTYSDLIAFHNYYTISQMTEYQSQNEQKYNQSILVNVCQNPTVEPHYSFSNSETHLFNIIGENDNCGTFQIMTKQTLIGSGGNVAGIRYVDRTQVASSLKNPSIFQADYQFYESNYYTIDPIPQGYEGLFLNTGQNYEPYTPDYTDKISMYYNIVDKHVTLTNTTQQMNLSTMACQWTMAGNDYTTVLDIITSCDQIQNVDVTKYQLYTVTLSILMDKNGDNTILPDESIASIHKSFNIDGTTQQGGFGSNWTDNPEWTDKTCDLVNLIGCLANLMHYAFGYNGENNSIITTPLYQIENNTFGITSIITVPFDILANLQSAQYQCNEITLPLPFVNGNLKFPCLRQTFYEPYLGTLFVLYQTVISGIICYYIYIKILEIIKNAKDPNKDMIEVMNL